MKLYTIHILYIVNIRERYNGKNVNNVVNLYQWNISAQNVIVNIIEMYIYKMFVMYMYQRYTCIQNVVKCKIQRIFTECL